MTGIKSYLIVMVWKHNVCTKWNPTNPTCIKKKIPRVFYLGSYDFLNWYVINESENNNL